MNPPKELEFQETKQSVKSTLLFPQLLMRVDSLLNHK